LLRLSFQQIRTQGRRLPLKARALSFRCLVVCRHTQEMPGGGG